MKTILYNSLLPKEYVNALGDFCDRAFAMPPCEFIKDSTAAHPDMLGFCHDGKLYINKDYYIINKSFFDKIDIELVLCDEKYAEYPNDVLFNCIAIEDKLISRTKSTAKNILKAFPCHVNVNQGYTKCSTLVMRDAFVTADSGIYKALTDLGYDTLKITQGGIRLAGFDYGFIGGAVCEVAQNLLFAFGNLSNLADYEAIKTLAKKHNYDIIDFARQPLCDFGGVLICNN